MVCCGHKIVVQLRNNACPCIIGFRSNCTLLIILLTCSMLCVQINLSILSFVPTKQTSQLYHVCSCYFFYFMVVGKGKDTAHIMVLACDFCTNHTTFFYSECSDTWTLLLNVSMSIGHGNVRPRDMCPMHRPKLDVWWFLRWWCCLTVPDIYMYLYPTFRYISGSSKSKGLERFYLVFVSCPCKNRKMRR